MSTNNPLRSPQVRAFAEALEAIHSEMNLAQFPERVIAVLESLIPDVVITIDEFNTKTGVARDAINRPPPNYEQWLSHLRGVVPVEHPAYHAVLSGHRGPLTLRDFLTNRQLRSTSLFSNILKPIEGGYQIVVPLIVPDHVAGITINRNTDFTEDELTVVRLLSPHIALAHGHAQHFTALHEARQKSAPDPDILVGLGLTKREAEVLYWVIHGKRDSEIAQISGGSVRTIQKHVGSVLAKLGCETRTAAVLEAILRCHGFAPKN